MPYMLERVGRFCEEVETETPKQDALDLVRYWFGSGDPRLGLWAVLNEPGQVVAHLLAVPEIVGDQVRSVLIRQAAIDRGVDIGTVSQQVFAEVEQWARSIGAPKLLMVTHRDEQAMARKWGFSAGKSLMTKLLTTGG